MTITWHLAAILKDRKMTAYQLAKQAKLTNSTAYKLARAKSAPRLEVSTLEALCKVLDCSPGDLLKFKGK